MSRLTFRGHKGYGFLKGKSCSYASHSFDCQLDEGVKLLDAAFEKLTQYEDLEEQGRLLELPVKPGTIVYKIVSGCVSEADLCDGKCVNCNDYQEYILEPVMSIGAIVSQLKDFGKNIFLTREEADKALKKMKEGETDDKSR